MSRTYSELVVAAVVVVVAAAADSALKCLLKQPGSRWRFDPVTSHHVHQVPGKSLTGCPSHLLLRNLLVHYRQYQRQVRQRRKIQNQTRCLDDQLDIRLLLAA